MSHGSITNCILHVPCEMDRFLLSNEHTGIESQNHLEIIFRVFLSIRMYRNVLQFTYLQRERKKRTATSESFLFNQFKSILLNCHTGQRKRRKKNTLKQDLLVTIWLKWVLLFLKLMVDLLFAAFIITVQIVLIYKWMLEYFANSYFSSNIIIVKTPMTIVEWLLSWMAYLN